MLHLAESFQFTATVLFIYTLAKISPMGSLSHLWMKGLEFCVPPTDEYIDEIISSNTPTAPQSKRHGRRSSQQTELMESPNQKPVVLHLAQISSPCLQDHFFFEEFDLLVVSFVILLSTLLFYEVWSFLIEEFFHGPATKLVLPPSSLGFGLVLVAIIFCLKTLISVIKYAGSESYEMRFSLLVGISSSILSFFILSVPESVLNFGFHEGFYEFILNCHNAYPYYPSNLINFTMFCAIMSLIAGLFAGVTVYPGLRIARCHVLLQKEVKTGGWMASVNWLVSTISILLPILCIIAWIDPMLKNLIVPEFSESSKWAENLFDQMRLVLVFLLCMIRLYLVRPYLQAHLNTSLTLAEEFMNCSQRRILLLLRDRMYGIYAYLCVVCVQLVAPVGILLLFVLQAHSRGEFRLGLLTSFVYDEGSSYDLIPASLLESVFSFLAWWFILWWFVISLAGMVYEKQRNHG